MSNEQQIAKVQAVADQSWMDVEQQIHRDAMEQEFDEAQSM